MTLHPPDANVLARKRSPDPRVVWEARVSGDRGRLVLCAVIAPSTEPIVVELPSERELRELLTATPDQAAAGWVCACGQLNEQQRSWCRGCSEHQQGPA